MQKETLNGRHIYVSKQDIYDMDRDELIHYLECRGYACYDDESTSLLRETALDDVENC